MRLKRFFLKAGRSGKLSVVRWTKQAAAAVKSRILHVYDWTNVINEAKKFETGGVYAGTVGLTAAPNGPFPGKWIQHHREYLLN